MPERYQVSITNIPLRPNEVSVRVDWGEDDNQFSEERIYPSIQQMMSKVSREGRLNMLKIGAGGVVTLAGALIFTGIAIFMTNDSADLTRQSYLILGGVACGFLVAKGLDLSDRGTKGFHKTDAIEREISRVVRADYTIPPTGGSWLGWIRSSFRF